MKKSLMIISIFGVTAAIGVTIYLANQKLRHNDNAKKQKSTEKESETCLINPNEDLHEKNWLLQPLFHKGTIQRHK